MNRKFQSHNGVNVMAPNVSRLDKKDLLFTMLFPSIAGKMAVVYFGLMYSAYPGEGWGYALLGTVGFTVFSVARFLWKYRHWDDG